MTQHYNDMNKFSDDYIRKFENVTDKFLLTEEIDAAYARANSIEKNRDMRNKNNLTRKKMWIKIAQGIQEIRGNI